MRPRYVGWGLVSGLALVWIVASQAASQGNVTAQLAAFKVQAAANGQEFLQATEHVRPGDIVEYRAVYRNTGKELVKQVQATLPIPAGMEYQGNSAHPAPVQASLDGTTFAPVPLRRQVRLADGRTEMQEVPYAEYRFLQWALDSLATGKEKTVRARVQVSAVGGQAAQERRTEKP